MNVSSHTIHRLATTTGLVAVVATLAIPVSLAGGPSPVRVTGQSSNTLDPAIATAMASHKNVQLESMASSQALDPAIAAAIASHKDVQTLATAANSQRLDPAIATAMASHRNTPAAADTPTPNAVDVPIATAIAARKGLREIPPSVPGNGFEWDNFGIAAALGMTLLLVTLVGQSARQGRDKSHGSVTAG